MKFSNEKNKDKFYTKKELVDTVLQNIDISKYNTIIEPSAGDGSFSKRIEGCIAMDLYPEDNSVIKQDWFTYEHGGNEKFAVVGNPPFGKRNVLAKAFIKKAVDLGADMIAFVLTDTFVKPTYQNVAKGYSLTKIMKLQDNGFTLDGNDHHVPCTLFVWEKKSTKKDLTWRKGTHTTDDFVSVSEKDFDTGAGFRIKQALSTDMVNPLSGKTNYFMPKEKSLDEIMEVLTRIKWSGYSAVNGGVIALSIEEVIKLYNEEKTCEMKKQQ